MPHRANAEILIIDDDPLTRELLRKTICATGLACAEVADGMEAWQAIHEKPPSLLLLDYDLPQLDGAELLKKLRAEKNTVFSQIPAIMLTGHTDERSEVVCLEAGADDFVTKPINMSILRARIDTQLRLRYMRRQLEKQNEELEAWRRNLERDLEAARLTQQALIPQKPLPLDGWDIATFFRPVIQVGGDIFGWLRMSDERTLFWIADATGHGASAALLTTLTKFLFHHGSGQQASPLAIVNAVNDDFRSIFGARQFMTAMCLALDPVSGRTSVIGAGHPPLMLVRANGERELIWSSAPPLGLADRAQFTESIVDLAGGDLFVLYTDGLLSGDGGKRGRVAPQQLLETIDISAPTMETMLAKLARQSALADNNSAPADDIAAVAVRRTAKK
ncbi:MAG: phosphoserine phosphatase RsbU/P [Verrucomicrobiota bacterium]|jgi:sigma-B regulation protein RsbU (phosphoserine phosphatase)